MRRGLSFFNVTALTFGFAFLYLPILLLVIYSFNESRLVTVWGGFSTRWYGELFRNEALMNAAWVTLRIAFVSAAVATVLGTLAAISLTRYGRFRGRALFTGMIYAPMVMPEVITGLSLLLLFVAIDLGRGFFLDAVVSLQDYSGFAAPERGRQVGLLGTDLLGCYATTIDWEERSLRLALRDERAPPSPAEVALPLQRVLGLPTVEVTLGRLALPCRLDTGAAYLDPTPRLDVNEATVRALREDGHALEEAGALHVRGIAGSHTLPLLRARPPLTLRLGPLQVDGVLLVVHAQGTLAGPTPLALASASLLQRTGRITIDPFDEVVRLPRGPRRGPL